MVKLFHRDILTQAIIIILVLLLLWGRALLAPAAMEAGDHPAVLYGLLCRWLAAVPRLTVVIAMLLVLAEGVTLNLLLANVNLVSQNSLLPTLLYIVAMSAGATTLTPAILVSGVAIVSLDRLVLRGTLLTIPPERICGATLLIGLAALFYQPAALLMLSYLLIASSYRLYNWKDWMLMLLGFAIPYVLLLLVLYMTDGLHDWLRLNLELGIRKTETGLHPSAADPRLPVSDLASILLAAVMLWSLISVIGRVGERPVLWQKNATTVMLFAIGGVGMMLFTPLLPIQTAFLAIPFAFVTYRLFVSATERPTGYGRRRKQRTWIYDLLLIAILIAALLC